MVKYRCLLLLLAICWLGLAVPAAASVHVIAHANAEALVPVIEPLVGQGGYVKAYQGRLIIKADDEAVARIRELLAQLPSQPRTVSIYLRRHATAIERDGGIRAGRRGVIIEGGSRRQQSESSYMIQALSGHAVSITQGSLIAAAGGYYPVLVNLQQGIWATAEIVGDNRVRLHIEQRFARRDRGGHIDTQGAATTLLLTPGQWQALGQIEVQAQDDELGLGGIAGHGRSMQLPLAVKVELR
ncbi:MAG TPA: secretin N-terminal domain-containing protein [Salinisphaeraceae bacterium]|nr:secretin N-terminal domain-containing protein [Salinisphaeraceae bacterium]